MGLEFKDYYRTLGVPKTASQPEIRAAFRRLAREHHPDVARDKRRAEERFKEINEAYEVLGDPEKRERYDTLGPSWQGAQGFGTAPGRRGARARPGGSGGSPDFEYAFGGTGFSEFFEQLFSARNGRRASGRERVDVNEDEARGQDVEADLLVTLEESLRGVIRPISVRLRTVCSRCGGTGRVGPRPCPGCEGDGEVENTVSSQVKVPAGVRDGQRLRVAGRGQQGFGGGAPGDLYLRVRLARHPDFEVEGNDLIHELDLAPWEAVLGTQVRVPALDGEVSIRIPPASQNGQRLRLRGRGLPTGNGARGDLLVLLRVQVPGKATAQEQALWQELARISDFRPRDADR